MPALCDDCGHPLPNDTGTYCPSCGTTRRTTRRRAPATRPAAIVWRNEHANECPVAEARAALPAAAATMAPAVLAGVVAELDYDGDDEHELCTCGAAPGGGAA